MFSTFATTIFDALVEKPQVSLIDMLDKVQGLDYTTGRLFLDIMVKADILRNTSVSGYRNMLAFHAPRQRATWILAKNEVMQVRAKLRRE